MMDIVSSRDEEAFLERCEEVKKIAFSFKDPLIAHHYDCDGLASASVVCAAFLGQSKKYRTRQIKKVDDDTITSLQHEKEIIFVDLGSGNSRVNELNDVVIIDHHQTNHIEKLQANSMLFGIDGGSEISAAGTAYCVFKTRVDLAIVGAIGDMQVPLIGMNRKILDEGVKSGEIKIENDLCFYGRYSRTLINFLLYSDDPYIPGLSYKEEKVVKFLQDLGIPLKDREEWRTYSDLSEEEKRKIVSAIASLFVDKGKAQKPQTIIGEAYVILRHRCGSEIYEANEFSTLLNACGRHGKSEIGIAVCLGEKNALEEASNLLSYHRTKLKEGVSFGLSKIQDFGSFYLLDARNVIKEEIIGTVCGMLLRPDMKKPIFGVSIGENNTLKWSVRYPKMLKGNMGIVIKNAAEEVGGIGGGHRIAAGASIPKDKINEFLVALGKDFH